MTGTDGTFFAALRAALRAQPLADDPQHDGSGWCAVLRRAEELHIAELYQGVTDKLAKLREVAEKFGAAPDEIAYIGDDLNDLACIRFAGITAAPADAMEQVKKEVDYVCRQNGGHGAVREFLDLITADE